MTESSNYHYPAQEQLLDQRLIRMSDGAFNALDDKLSVPGVARARLVKLFASEVDWIGCLQPGLSRTAQ